MGRASQRKGKNGELELADLLRAYGYNVQRGGSLTFGSVPDLSGLPAVFHRRNREQWLVTLRLDDFMRLYGGKDGTG